MNEVIVQDKTASGGVAKSVYILYLVGVIFGFTGIIGVIMAYINRGGAPEWLKSHYQFQIRTFWIGAFYMLIGAMLAIILIGYLVFIFWVVWLVIRCIQGMSFLDKKQAYPNPTGWMF